MKSKKIVAMIVAFAAFMAVATSGLAAVTTTTEYYINDINKVSVEVAVTSAAAGSEVTYLVETTAGTILYIDQQTANENGAVNFNYKIAKDKVIDANYSASVKFGTDGTSVVWDEDDNVNFSAVSADANDHATITFYTDEACSDGMISGNAYVGTEDTIYAKIAVDDNYKIDSVTGLTPTATEFIYIVNDDVANVSVAVSEKVTAPSVSLPTEEDLSDEDAATLVGSFTEAKDKETGEKIEGDSTVKFLKVVGNPTTEFGIKCANPDDASDEWKFPALTTGFENDLDDVDFYAVRIMLGDKEITSFDAYMD